MEGFIGLIIVGIVLYFGYHLMIAFFKGMGEATQTIHDDGPGFFSKVIQSVVAGVILAVTLGAESGIVGPLALGVAAVSFFMI